MMGEERMFKPGDIVRHRCGNLYAIECLAYYEPTVDLCYVYCRAGDDEHRWVRPVSVMEDGRFTLVEGLW